MGLTLVTGPANSAKAGEVLGAYGAAVGHGAMLVVPTADDARHYERELATDGVALGSVLTFDGLVGVIAQRAGYAGRRLSALQRQRVLAGVIADLGLDALRDSARGAGFAVAAGELLAELQRSLVTPQRFAAALRAWAAQDVRRAPFTRDVGRIYGAYVRDLDRRGWVDRELFAWRALDALRAGDGAWGRDAVFFYGFDDLTALERDAIETLARIPGVAVTVSLTYEPGRAALLARAESVEELRPLADEVVELPASDEHYAPASRAVLHRIERELFEDRAGAPDGNSGAAPGVLGSPSDGVVTLLEAGGERAEGELVAAEILALARAGTPLEEIVVVYRSAARAMGLLRRVFAAYGIPLGAGAPVAFGHTPLGRALLGAARCAWLGERARAEDLLAYLRAPGLLHGPDAADALEADVRRAGLTTGAQARELLGWELRELDSLAAAVADPGDELCRMGRRLLVAPHRGAAAQLDADEELDAAAVGALVTACAELSEIAGWPGPGPAGAAALIELLAGVPVPVARGAGSGVGEVRLAEPAQIRARRFAVVFVCGLQEGELPGPARGEPFFSDERRRELAMASGLALGAHEDALDGERYLFYSAVSRATERVFLSYRSSDEEGNLALASPFIADVAELVGPGLRERRRRRTLADVTWPPDRAPTDRERERAAAAARAPLTGDETVAPRRLGAAALEGMRHTRVVSPGALERYAECPVRWLVESELGPEPLAPTPEPLARGSLIHELLEGVLAQLDGPVTSVSLARAETILETLIATLAADPAGAGAGAALGAGQPAAVRAAALRAIEADLRRYLRHEAAAGGDWPPVGLELRFGFEDEPTSLPALVLGEGEQTTRVRGVVDRIDADAAGHAIVRDYKSGAPQQSWPVARWSQDGRLQVALYMLVARELAGLDPVAGVYQPLRGEDLRARGVFVAGTPTGSGLSDRDARSPDELDAELADAARRAVALAVALRSGELTPCPQTCSRDGCSYPGICRSQ